MPVKVAINGYGRIGRNILRALYESKRTHEIQIVAVNDLGDAKTNAHLTRYDTAHGPFPSPVGVDGDHLVVGGDRIKVCAERDPSKLPWGQLGVDVVLECTGLFTTKEKAGDASESRCEEGHHLGAGRQGCRRDDRLWRQSQDAEGEPHRHLERFVHDELLGAGRESAARHGRSRARHHDDDSLLYERPGADRRLPQRFAPRALGDAEHDSDEDRRRRGCRPRAAGARRQARRLRRACADDQRVARRPDVRGWASDLGQGDRRGYEEGEPRRSQGRARVRRRAARLERLQPQSGVVAV